MSTGPEVLLERLRAAAAVGELAAVSTQLQVAGVGYRQTSAERRTRCRTRSQTAAENCNGNCKFTAEDPKDAGDCFGNHQARPKEGGQRKEVVSPPRWHRRTSGIKDEG